MCLMGELLSCYHKINYCRISFFLLINMFHTKNGTQLENDRKLFFDERKLKSN